MRTTHDLPVCQICLDSLMGKDEYMMLFYIDLCATHYHYGASIRVEYSDGDYLSEDYINHLESIGLIKTVDDFNEGDGVKVLPCMRQQLNKICYCSEEKKHFGG